MIYEWMLEDVLNRVHDKSGNVIIPGCKAEDIARLLEEVAVTAWHSGDIRATTKSRVRTHCEKANLTDLLDKVFPDKAKSNITSLFLAFYFQEAYERQGQERAFEFSHKSYGEYLLVRRFRGFLHELQRRLDDGAWTDEEALKRWAQLFGPSGLTRELHNFAYDAFDLEEPETRDRWRHTICKLFCCSYIRGTPMQQLDLGTFLEMSRQDRHATTALLIMHSACYRVGDRFHPLQWRGRPAPSGVRLGDFLIRLIGHPEFLRDSAESYLRGWDWSGVNLVGANLYAADFEGADLSRAALGWADLGESVLEEADLRGANVSEANLDGSRVKLEWLHCTNGNPRTMPDGKPPKKNWHKVKPKVLRRNKENPEPPASAPGASV